MLQILYLSMASQKIGIPSSYLPKFYHAPVFPSKTFKTPPPPSRENPLPPCGIHNERSLSRAFVSFTYLIWRKCYLFRSLVAVSIVKQIEIGVYTSVKKKTYIFELTPTDLGRFADAASSHTVDCFFPFAFVFWTCSLRCDR